MERRTGPHGGTPGLLNNSSEGLNLLKINHLARSIVFEAGA